LISPLANSIHTHGLLQNLTVQPGGKDETFSVIAGGRRLMALQHLAKQKKLPANWPVPCNVIEIGDMPSDEISLAENEMRHAMHPADQFEAFKKLVDEGQGEETIAAKFGVTPHVVKQRLKLAVVSPKLIKAYRNGDMNLECLMAFTITDDHKRQEKVWADWKGMPEYNQDADSIRGELTEEHVPGTHKLAKFVGIAAYEKAGGIILRDLFSQDDDGLFHRSFFASKTRRRQD
jgi:ParB family transcriptional regulator, chromosome partitioning protein